MPKWTKEQLRAINESGNNIIVSAGAGSGKTAVLTERVITKLKSGINIQNLLILTFTNAAASEMKSRIRSEISNIEEVKSQESLVDAAYITTFDSFAMSVVKKYHYLLNVSPNINVIDKNICDNIRNSILDDIFENEYLVKNECFCKLIDDLTIKDDKEIKKCIIDVNNKLDRLINKNEYLNGYLDRYYSYENISNIICEYNNYIDEKVSNLKSMVLDMYNYCDEKYYSKFIASFNNLINSKGYDEVKCNIDVDIPRLPKNSEEVLKNIKKKISEDLKSFKKELIYKNEEHIRSTINSTKDYASIIIDIIKKLDEKLFEYKNRNDVYEFNDIAKMAIDVIKNNEEVRCELRDNFAEIMVDEYQDTSDIQEEFINLISNNNVYMVGDVKQSIYRFRNANPDIFKVKYDKYSNNDGGIKIDLLNNFRSRSEVLDDINSIFNIIMDSKIGGADYEKTHQMVFGNVDYTNNHPEQNFNLDIYNYTRDNKRYSEAEYEAFIIVNDIKNKINTGYKIYDRGIKSLRNVQYKDFCILIDRKSKFELYKKIFEYSGVPLMIFYDEKITQERDILIIKSIIDLIVKIYNNEYDVKFKYDFYSIWRSYLFDYSDEDYLKMYNSNNFKDNLIYEKCKNIASKLDSLSNKNLIDMIVFDFDFYEKCARVCDIEKFIVRVDYLKNLADSLSDLGYSIIDFNNYLQELVCNDSDITISENVRECDNVKLMNIHKSKGLEFPICYFSGYSSKFNRDDFKSIINFDNKYGFILPFYDDGVGRCITYKLFEDKNISDDVSERIRLLYVALTRAKEKMIIVADIPEEEAIFNYNVKKSYKSFLDIIFSIKDKISDRIVCINDVSLTKDYNNAKISNGISLNSSDMLNGVIDVNIENDMTTSSQVSKQISSLLTKEDTDKLKYGILEHRILEVSDFSNSNNKIVNNLVSKLGDISNCKIYREYEFIDSTLGKKYHGIIDLMIEYENCIKIVDYKLKNIDDEAYVKQLSIYKNYIERISNKKVNIYLYSIINDVLKEIVC